MERQNVIAYYRGNPEISVLVIGAGINGIGTFRDLALQGVDVLLVDKADFCSGASAASSRMAHGGIRYLENGEFRLVRESLTERNRLLQNAPHAVEPLLFTIPVYGWLSGMLNAPLKFLGLLQRPSERGALVVKLGMMLYDWFTRSNRMTPTHRILWRKEALAKHAKLNPQILCAATYYDAIMPQAERIGLELVLDAEADCPNAHALNYVSVQGGGGDTVQLKDELTGETFAVKPRVVINASGAWIDFVNRTMQHPTRVIGGTKGSHIVVEHPELYQTLNGSAIFFENKDGRLCIFAPFYDKVIIGATDIRIDDPDQAVCSDDEIDYFLQFSQHVLPGIQVERSQIVAHFSGVRPLPTSDVSFVGLISRDHHIHVLEPDNTLRFPVYSLIGGKWTTFRAFAAEATDKAIRFLGRARIKSTENLPIGGGTDYPRTPAERETWITRVARATGLTHERMQTLFARYGTRAEMMAQFIAAHPDAPLRHLPGYSRREIQFLFQHEKAERLDDIVLRRSPVALLGLVNRETLIEIGALAGWPEARAHAEIERSAELLTRQNGVRLEPVGEIVRA
jgi:glycerol-3-phosphate dehydrogenase